MANRKIFYGYVDTRCYKAGAAQLPEVPQETNRHHVIKTGGYVVAAGFGGGGRSSGKTNPRGVKINSGYQNKYILGTNNYNREISNGRNKSILTVDPQEVLDNYAGTGQKTGINKESINFDNIMILTLENMLIRQMELFITTGKAAHI